MKKLLLIALFILSHSLSAQEKLKLQLNTQTILPGEYLYFSLRLQTNETALNQVAYVGLINPLGEQVLTAQMLLKESTSSKPMGTQSSNIRWGQGDLFIPARLATGAYTLVAYTAAAPKVSLPMALLNPYTTKRIGQVIENITKEENEKSPLISTVFGPLEKISWESLGVTEVLEKAKLVSLSIRKKESLASFASLTEEYFEAGTPKKIPQQSEASEAQTHGPGAHISGQIIPKKMAQNSADSTLAEASLGTSALAAYTSKELTQIRIALSFLGQDMPFKITTPNRAGRFSFPINSPINQNKAILEIMGSAKENYRIVLDPMPLPPMDKVQKAVLHLYSADLEALTERSILNQVENAFNRFKPDSIALENKPISDFSYLESSDYLLEEYTSFPTFEETVFEIISELSYEKTAAGGAVLYCKGVKRNTPVAAPPLLLIDGIPVEDQNAFRTYATKDIALIKVIQKQMVIGNKIWNGLVEIKTQNGIPLRYINNNGLKIKTLKLPELDKKYYQIQETSLRASDTLGRIPHMNPQLIWRPNLETGKDRLPAYFYTSSLKGSYELKAFYLDHEGIEKVWTKGFRVK